MSQAPVPADFNPEEADNLEGCAPALMPFAAARAAAQCREGAPPADQFLDDA